MSEATQTEKPKVKKTKKESKRLRLHIISDPHIEFHSDGGKDFFKRVNKIEKDLLIIAGDLANYPLLDIAFSSLIQQVEAPILLVLGNHDYYKSSLEEGNRFAKSWMDIRSDLYVLDNEGVEIGGKVFYGGTGWFPEKAGNRLVAKGMADYYHIKDYLPTAYSSHNQFKEGLVKSGADIVVSHHFPFKQSISPEFKYSPLNRFFHSSLDEFVFSLEKLPDLWIHGHTHSSCSYTHKGIEIICNPYGYKDLLINNEYRNNYTVETTNDRFR